MSPLVDEVWTAFHLKVGVASGYTHLITSGNYDFRSGLTDSSPTVVMNTAEAKSAKLGKPTDGLAEYNVL